MQETSPAHRERHALRLQLVPDQLSPSLEDASSTSHPSCAAPSDRDVSSCVVSRQNIRNDSTEGVTVVSPHLRRCLTEYDEYIDFLPASVMDVSSPSQRSGGAERDDAKLEGLTGPGNNGDRDSLSRWPAKLTTSLSSAFVQRRGVTRPGSDLVSPLFSSFLADGRHGSRNEVDSAGFGAGEGAQGAKQCPPLLTTKQEGRLEMDDGNGEPLEAQCGSGRPRVLTADAFPPSQRLSRSTSLDSSLASSRKCRAQLLRATDALCMRSPLFTRNDSPLFSRVPSMSLTTGGRSELKLEASEPGSSEERKSEKEYGTQLDKETGDSSMEDEVVSGLEGDREVSGRTLLQPDFHTRLQAALREQEECRAPGLRLLRQQEMREQGDMEAEPALAPSHSRGGDEEGRVGPGVGRLNGAGRRRGKNKGAARLPHLFRVGGPDSDAREGILNAVVAKSSDGGERTAGDVEMEADGEHQSDWAMKAAGAEDVAALLAPGHRESREGEDRSEKAKATTDAQQLPEDAVIRMLSLSVELDIMGVNSCAVGSAEDVARMTRWRADLDDESDSSVSIRKNGVENGASASGVASELKDREILATRCDDKDQVVTRVTEKNAQRHTIIEDLGTTDGPRTTRMVVQHGDDDSSPRESSAVLRLDDVSLPLYPIGQTMDCSPSTPTSSPIACCSRFARQLVFSASRSPRARPFFFGSHHTVSGPTSCPSSAFAPTFASGSRGALANAQDEKDEERRESHALMCALGNINEEESGEEQQNRVCAIDATAGVGVDGVSDNARETGKKSEVDDSEERCVSMPLFQRKKASPFCHEGELLLASPLAPPHPDILTPRSAGNACGARLLLGPAPGCGVSPSPQHPPITDISPGAVCGGAGVGAATWASSCRCFLPEDSLSLFLEIRSTLLNLLEELHDACCCCHPASSKGPSLRFSPCCAYHFPASFPCSLPSSSSCSVTTPRPLSPSSPSPPASVCHSFSSSSAIDDTVVQSRGSSLEGQKSIRDIACAGEASLCSPASASASPGLKALRPPGLEPLCPHALAAEVSPSSSETVASPVGTGEFFREAVSRGDSTPPGLCGGDSATLEKVVFKKDELKEDVSSVVDEASPVEQERDEKEKKIPGVRVSIGSNVCAFRVDGKQNLDIRDECPDSQKKSALRAKATTTVSTTVSAITPACTPTASGCFVDSHCGVSIVTGIPVCGVPSIEDSRSESPVGADVEVKRLSGVPPSPTGIDETVESTANTGLIGMSESGFAKTAEAVAAQKKAMSGEIERAGDSDRLSRVADGLLSGQQTREGFEEEERASISSGATRCPGTGDKNAGLGGRCSLDTPAASPSSSVSVASPDAYSFSPFTRSGVGAESPGENQNALSASSSPALLTSSTRHPPLPSSLHRVPGVVSPFASSSSLSVCSSTPMSQGGVLPRCGPALHALFFEHVDCLRSSRCFVEQLAYAHIFRMCLQTLGGGRPSSLSPLQQQFLVRELFLLRQEPNRLLVRNAFMWTGQPGCRHILDQLCGSSVSLSAGMITSKNPFAVDRDKLGAAGHATQHGAYGWGGLHGMGNGDGSSPGFPGGFFGFEKSSSNWEFSGQHGFDDLRKNGSHAGQSRISTRGQSALAAATATSSGEQARVECIGGVDDGTGKEAGYSTGTRKGRTFGDQEESDDREGGGKADQKGDAAASSDINSPVAASPAKALLDPSIFLCTADMEVGAQKSALVASLRALRSLAPSWASQPEGGFAFHLQQLLQARSLHSQTLQNYRVILQELFSVPPRLWGKERLLDALHDLDCLYSVTKRRAEARQKRVEEMLHTSRENADSGAQDMIRRDDEGNESSHLSGAGEGQEHRAESVRVLQQASRLGQTGEGGSGGRRVVIDDARLPKVFGSGSYAPEDSVASRSQEKPDFLSEADDVHSADSFFKGSRRREDTDPRDPMTRHHLQSERDEHSLLNSEELHFRQGRSVCIGGKSSSSFDAAESLGTHRGDSSDLEDPSICAKGWPSTTGESDTQALQQVLEEQLRRQGLSAHNVGAALAQVLRSGGTDAALKALQRLLAPSRQQGAHAGGLSRDNRVGAMERSQKQLLRQLIQGATSMSPSLGSSWEANGVSLAYASKLRGVSSQRGGREGDEQEPIPLLGTSKQRGLERSGASPARSGSGMPTDEERLGTEVTERGNASRRGKPHYSESSSKRMKTEGGHLRRHDASLSLAVGDDELQALSALPSPNDQALGSSRAHTRHSPLSRQSHFPSPSAAGLNGNQKLGVSGHCSSRRHEAKEMAAGEGRGKSYAWSAAGNGREGGVGSRGSGTGRESGSGGQKEEQAERLEYARRAATLEKVKGVFIGKKNTCWVAQWTDSSGRSRQTCYNIKALGFEVARQKAIEERQRQMGSAPIIVSGGSGRHQSSAASDLRRQGGMATSATAHASGVGVVSHGSGDVTSPAFSASAQVAGGPRDTDELISLRNEDQKVTGGPGRRQTMSSSPGSVSPTMFPTDGLPSRQNGNSAGTANGTTAMANDALLSAVVHATANALNGVGVSSNAEGNSVRSSLSPTSLAADILAQLQSASRGLSPSPSDRRKRSVDLLRSLSGSPVLGASSTAPPLPSAVSPSSPDGAASTMVPSAGLISGGESGRLPVLAAQGPESPLYSPASSCEDPSRAMAQHSTPGGFVHASSGGAPQGPSSPSVEASHDLSSPSLIKDAAGESEQEMKRMTLDEKSGADATRPTTVDLHAARNVCTSPGMASSSFSLSESSPLVAPSLPKSETGVSSNVPSLASLSAALSQAFPNLASAMSVPTSNKVPRTDSLSSVSPEHLQLFQQLAEQFLPSQQRLQPPRNSHGSAASIGSASSLSLINPHVEMSSVSRNSPIFGNTVDPGVLSGVAELSSAISQTVRSGDLAANVGNRHLASSTHLSSSLSQLHSTNLPSVNSFSTEPPLSRASSGCTSASALPSISLHSTNPRLASPSTSPFQAPSSEAGSSMNSASSATRRESSAVPSHPSSPATKLSFLLGGHAQGASGQMVDVFSRQSSGTAPRGPEDAYAVFAGPNAGRGRRHRMAYTHKQGRRTYASQARDFPRVEGIEYNVKCACWEVRCGASFKVFSTRRLGGLQEAYDLAVKWKQEVEGGSGGNGCRRLVSDRRLARNAGTVSQNMMMYLGNDGSGGPRVSGGDEDGEADEEADHEEGCPYPGESDAGNSLKRGSRSGSSKEDQEDDDRLRVLQHTEWGAGNRVENPAVDRNARALAYDLWMRSGGSPSCEDGAPAPAMSLGEAALATQRPQGDVDMLTSLLEQLSKTNGTAGSGSVSSLQEDSQAAPEDICGALTLLAGAVNGQSTDIGKQGSLGDVLTGDVAHDLRRLLRPEPDENARGSAVNRDTMVRGVKDGGQAHENGDDPSPGELRGNGGRDSAQHMEEHKKRSREYDGHNDPENRLINAIFAAASSSKKARTD
ncbi:AP2 domain transcription factor AP2VIIa-4 [Toxoplasma gondii GAB2-2007-GAL-DOM2]|uniref:AP2 domain transcription factor AP2VIIa-4 n=4 Tax=Toxoplasma gondii TaxID=5811 RepID=S7UV85_TOXGG|nr:AP2 domain transcription factor AP2VIIa-4 [Toxoplasma gondii GT1]KAF4642806.1 AP2 domain transcription factor AP2VIIa-4 [Toxoplasma gondii]KFG37907.1 AP2 domain transcription factor AP2VIIa-4 [Toxoplasma gondii GAB2-2007-GAL-DOM2]KFG39387.1 AP2 domain transcription factor AP2VIIa-4 [Toxoplasma gondii FOU]